MYTYILNSTENQNEDQADTFFRLKNKCKSNQRISCNVKYLLVNIGYQCNIYCRRDVICPFRV